MKMTPTMSRPSVPRCDACRFWKRWDAENPQNISADEWLGDCRRYAPRTKVGDIDEDKQLWALWPSTLGGEWCGEHQPRANDILALRRMTAAPSGKETDVPA